LYNEFYFFIHKKILLENPPASRYIPVEAAGAASRQPGLAPGGGTPGWSLKKT